MAKNIELHVRPWRLDLDRAHCRRARERGRISVDPDAHSIESLEDLEYGVAVARRGWLEAGHVVNAQPLERVREILLKR